MVPAHVIAKALQACLTRLPRLFNHEFALEGWCDEFDVPAYRLDNGEDRVHELGWRAHHALKHDDVGRIKFLAGAEEREYDGEEGALSDATDALECRP